MRLSFRLLSPALLLALSLPLVGCDSGGSPTRPFVPSIGPSNWSGTRELTTINEGEGTCLAEFLQEDNVQRVTADLPGTSAPGTFGTVQIPELGDNCVNFVDEGPTAVSWHVYRCSQHCWFESFPCGRRLWSYCRSYGEFNGTRSGSQLDGTQDESFSATDGVSNYLVRVTWTYRLERE